MVLLFLLGGIIIARNIAYRATERAGTARRNTRRTEGGQAGTNGTTRSKSPAGNQQSMLSLHGEAYLTFGRAEESVD